MKKLSLALILFLAYTVPACSDMISNTSMLNNGNNGQLQLISLYGTGICNKHLFDGLLNSQQSLVIKNMVFTGDRCRFTINSGDGSDYAMVYIRYLLTDNEFVELSSSGKKVKLGKYTHSYQCFVLKFPMKFKYETKKLGSLDMVVLPASSYCLQGCKECKTNYCSGVSMMGKRVLFVNDNAYVDDLFSNKHCSPGIVSTSIKIFLMIIIPLVVLITLGVVVCCVFITVRKRRQHTAPVASVLLQIPNPEPPVYSSPNPPSYGTHDTYAHIDVKPESISYKPESEKNVANNQDKDNIYNVI